jgi:hypothetical protein
MFVPPPYADALAYDRDGLLQRERLKRALFLARIKRDVCKRYPRLKPRLTQPSWARRLAARLRDLPAELSFDQQRDS